MPALVSILICLFICYKLATWAGAVFNAGARRAAGAASAAKAGAKRKFIKTFTINEGDHDAGDPHEYVLGPPPKCLKDPSKHVIGEVPDELSGEMIRFCRNCRQQVTAPGSV